MGYSLLNWVNGGPPARNATNLNHMDAGIKDASDRLDVVEASVYDARRYGAVGNGIANDRAAIQAAIDAAATAGGGTVYLRRGTYLLTAALVMKRRVILRGDGIAAEQSGTGTIVYQSTANADCLSGVDLRDITVQDMTLLGAGSGTGSGINLTRSANPDVSGVTLRRLQVSSFGAYGVTVSNAITSTFDRVLVDGCPAGIYLHGVLGFAGSAGTSVTLLNCYTAGCTQSGFRLDNMAYCAFVGCASDACGIAYELIESGTQGISFVGCGCESMVSGGASYPGIGWKINAAIGVTLTGCYTFDSPNISIWITGNANAVNVTGFSENTPQSGAVNSIKVDAGSIATVSDIATGKPVALNGTVVMVNDGGGVLVPGYLYVGGKISTDSVIGLRVSNTAGRPTAASAGAGAVMYDSSLGIPIYSNGTAWRNAAGTTV